MRVATWNINSLRARQERVEAWIDEVQPDVLLLQETKLADDAFPALTFEALGYASAHHGQGQWNGVAILSRVGLDDVVHNFAPGIEPDPDARIVTATCGGVRVSSVYVPNGRALDDDHYVYKLDWLGRLVQHVEADTSPDRDVLIGGDFNVAPEDRDVHDPTKTAGMTHVSEPERTRLAELEAWGFADVFRQHHDADRVFSWWDYRAGDFHQGRGMRIDLVMCSASMAARSNWCIIDRNARKGKSPSDHAPVIVDFD
ncbi:MAG: exodeoxyribonuclease III [Ilumatobacter sp.]|nr:exodeoxyribonuclease III [Ilumatobacter sp.]